MKKLGLVVAMEVEATLLIEKLGLKEIDNFNNVYYSDKSFGNYCSITLIISGIGVENSAIAAQILILKYDVDNILNFGYAGSNKLKTGTIVSPNKVFNNDFDLTSMGYEKYKIPGIEDLILEKISEYNNYSCYSANHFVTESKEEYPVIYDMELHGIAMVCSRYNKAICAIKIITDCLDVNVYNESESDTKLTESLTNSVMKYLK